MSDELKEHFSYLIKWAVDFAHESIRDRVRREGKLPDQALEDLLGDMYLLSFTMLDQIAQLQSLVKRYPSEARDLTDLHVMAVSIQPMTQVLRSYMQRYYGVR